MGTVIIVIQVLLILLFAAGGLTKLILPYVKFTKLPAQAWANDFKPEIVRLLGVLEMCAAVGMVVSLLLRSLTMLTPLVAVGMALFMSGAMATHLRRGNIRTWSETWSGVGWH